MSQGRAGAFSAVINGCFYVGGGRADCGLEVFAPDGSYLATVCRFDPSTATWEAAPSMHVPRWRAAAAVDGSRLFACGGCNGSHPVMQTAEVLDTVRGSWEMIPAMKHGHYGAVAAVLGGCLHVFGGHDGNRRLNSVFCLNSVWEETQPLFERCGGAVAVKIIF
eukprot:TRINITY_DN32525_c0_g1_i1.p1 TRINITY_DN32525_c0_g1~~TRINITY_DN32525_c0_g1_i1.p1  ORF type:complete len:164 (+),score=20.67 TRINITY_DN32525_c0_g1_i1:295-786(+)